MFVIHCSIIILSYPARWNNWCFDRMGFGHLILILAADVTHEFTHLFILKIVSVTSLRCCRVPILSKFINIWWSEDGHILLWSPINNPSSPKRLVKCSLASITWQWTHWSQLDWDWFLMDHLLLIHQIRRQSEQYLYIDRVKTGYLDSRGLGHSTQQYNLQVC